MTTGNTGPRRQNPIILYTAPDGKDRRDVA